MNNDVPSSLEEILRRELVPDERLVWRAVPASWSRVQASAGTFLFGIPFFAFSVFWTWGATGGFANQRASGQPGFGWFGFLWGGMFMLFGARMLLSPLWAWWVARHTLYAITDQRALLIEAPFHRTIQSFADERLATVLRRENRDGHGDIIFERQASRGSKGRTVYRDIGFFGLGDAKGVEQLLQATRADLTRAQPSTPRKTQGAAELGLVDPVDASPSRSMMVVRGVVGLAGFLLCWLVVAVVVGLAMFLIFPPLHGPPYTMVGSVLDWRNLPGTVLGLFAGIHSFRASMKEPRE